MVDTCALMDIRTSQAIDRSRRHHTLQFTFTPVTSPPTCWDDTHLRRRRGHLYLSWREVNDNSRLMTILLVDACFLFHPTCSSFHLSSEHATSVNIIWRKVTFEWVPIENCSRMTRYTVLFDIHYLHHCLLKLLCAAILSQSCSRSSRSSPAHFHTRRFLHAPLSLQRPMIRDVSVSPQLWLTNRCNKNDLSRASSLSFRVVALHAPMQMCIFVSESSICLQEKIKGFCPRRWWQRVPKESRPDGEGDPDGPTAWICGRKGRGVHRFLEWEDDASLLYEKHPSSALSSLHTECIMFMMMTAH